MDNDDVTLHPSWKSALCWNCGQPMKLENLQEKAEKLGIKYPPGQRKYHVYCCYVTNKEDSNEDDLEYQTVVALLRRYYGM
jgi:hypothetical protein